MDNDGTWHVGQTVFESHSLTKSQQRVRTSFTHPLQIETVTVGRNGGGVGITFCP